MAKEGLTEYFWESRVQKALINTNKENFIKLNF